MAQQHYSVKYSNSPGGGSSSGGHYPTSGGGSPGTPGHPSQGGHQGFSGRPPTSGQQNTFATTVVGYNAMGQPVNVRGDVVDPSSGQAIIGSGANPALAGGVPASGQPGGPVTPYGSPGGMAGQYGSPYGAAPSPYGQPAPGQPGYFPPQPQGGAPGGMPGYGEPPPGVPVGVDAYGNEIDAYGEIVQYAQPQMGYGAPMMPPSYGAPGMPGYYPPQPMGPASFGMPGQPGYYPPQPAGSPWGSLQPGEYIDASGTPQIPYDSLGGSLDELPEWAQKWRGLAPAIVDAHRKPGKPQHARTWSGGPFEDYLPPYPMDEISVMPHEVVSGAADGIHDGRFDIVGSEDGLFDIVGADNFMDDIGKTLSDNKALIEMVAPLAATAIGGPAAGILAGAAIQSAYGDSAAKSTVDAAHAAAQKDPEAAAIAMIAGSVVSGTVQAYHGADLAKKAANGDKDAIKKLNAIGKAAQAGHPGAQLAAGGALHVAANSAPSYGGAIAMMAAQA